MADLKRMRGYQKRRFATLRMNCPNCGEIEHIWALRREKDRWIWEFLTDRERDPCCPVKIPAVMAALFAEIA